jgi:hypothetical protein
MATSRVLVLLLAGLAAGSADPAAAATPGQRCERVASNSLRSCFRKVARLQQRCYGETGGPCATSDPKLMAALARVETQVLRRCPDQPTVTAAGHAPLLTPAGLAARLQEACGAAVASLVARSYGGPHAAVRNATAGSNLPCLERAFTKGRALIDYGLRRQSRCLRKEHAGRPCDVADLTAALAAREATTADQIAARCPIDLATLINLDPATFADRTAAQARCLVATAHGDTAPLALDCGPRPAVPVPPRATTVQVVLDNATWGTRCGNGSDYAFRLRLAPTGSPAGNVVVYMQGGGACYNGPGCANVSPALYEAMNDNMPGGGVFSNTAATNPFRNWTKVFLPYCTQDLHIGGGIADEYDEITVHRYGAVNVRAALRWVRDVVWAEMDATEPLGYRGDRVATLFSGGSAGGYGAAYNYHWVLDDLGWPHTAAAPDAGLGMDNGGLGIIALGAVMLLPESPGWNVGPYLPPYCFTSDCAEIFVNLEAATSPRLLGVPEQRILHVTNQIDNVQQSTTLFPSTAAFVNTLRQSYCDVQGMPGLHAFLRAESSSIHTQMTGSAWDTASIGGTLMRDWLGGVFSSPGTVIDKVATRTLEADYSGVAPFPCPVGSPSGAFVDD